MTEQSSSNQSKSNSPRSEFPMAVQLEKRVGLGKPLNPIVAINVYNNLTTRPS